MKKLVFILPGIAGGGAEKVVLNLYRAMELYKGYECHIVSIGNCVAHALDPGMRVHYLYDARKFSKKGLKRYTYRKVIAKIVDDYIDQNIGKSCIVLSNMMFCDKVMSLSRHRVFHIIHSAYSQSLLNRNSAFRQFFIKRNINDIYSHHPMIFVSQGARDSFCAGFNTDVDKYVIYNPVNEGEVKDLANSESVELHGDFVVHVGRFNRQKRHDRLLNAFARVKGNVKLLLLGEGRLEEGLRAQVEALGLSERVLFMGFRQNPYPFIKSAKALLLTSDVEGLSTVVLEALCIGTPVVTTDCPGGFREIFPDASPSLVPLDDEDSLVAAIEDVLVDPEKYRSALDPKFSSEFAVEQYDSLFRSTV
jgi:glycosyltransferase involved in cell wall biosynthesis